MLKRLKILWAGLRQLSGDDAYERYVHYYTTHQMHACQHHCEPLLSKKEFFKRWQDEKWQGIKRCC